MRRMLEVAIKKRGMLTSRAEALFGVVDKWFIVLGEIAQMNSMVESDNLKNRSKRRKYGQQYDTK